MACSERSSAAADGNALDWLVAHYIDPVKSPPSAMWPVVKILRPLVFQYLRSANRQLLAVPRYRLNTYGRRAFSVAGPTDWNSGTLSRISSGTRISSGIRPSMQTLSDVCLKRTCSFDTSAFSALEVIDDNHAL